MGAAAALIGGSAELLDFLIPLWGGIELGIGPSMIGVLVAVELLVSVVARPLSGWLVDTRPRTVIAAVGALLYAGSCMGYAFAGSLPIALAAAVMGGIGGAFFWVAARAVAAEFLDGDSGSLAGLLSSESFGSWFFWLPAMLLLPAWGFGGIFAALAAACLSAAFLLLRVPRTAPAPADHAAGNYLSHTAKLAPLLLLAALTATAEAGVSLLLLLHLQASLQLEIYQIALVYLPGGIVLTLVPRLLHRFVERHGRRTGYIIASLGSALTAAGLAFSPNPFVIAALWMLTSASWAIVVPIHGAIVAEVNKHAVGRGMGSLGNAGMLGAAAGALLAGSLYEAGSWQASCLVFAGILFCGTVLGPLMLAKLGVRNRPAAEPEEPAVDGVSPPASRRYELLRIMWPV